MRVSGFFDLFGGDIDACDRTQGGLKPRVDQAAPTADIQEAKGGEIESTRGEALQEIVGFGLGEEIDLEAGEADRLIDGVFVRGFVLIEEGGHRFIGSRYKVAESIVSVSGDWWTSVYRLQVRKKSIISWAMRATPR